MNLAEIKQPILARIGDSLNPILFGFNNEDGTPINIEDWTFAISIRNNDNIEVAYYDMESGLSIIDDAGQSKLLWSFPLEIAIVEGKHKFYVKYYNGGDGYQTILKGDFIVECKKVEL